MITVHPDSFTDSSLETANRSGFSLIEVTIALAIFATGILTVLALLAPGLETGRDSNAKTIVGIILEDVHNRLEGTELKKPPPTDPYVFLYDDQGQLIDTNQPAGIQDTKVYRVEVSILDIAASNLSNVGGSGSAQSGIMASKVDVFYPVLATTGVALPLGSADPKTSITYYITALTGPDWPLIDPSYIPKIEF